MKIPAFTVCFVITLCSIACAQDAGWTRLKVAKAESKGGEVFEVLADGSVLVSGPNPDASTYEVTCETDLERVTAIRLEALTHDSLPLTGPGRAANSHAVLTEFEAARYAKGAKRGQAINFARVAADERRWQGSQPDCHSAVIDRVTGTKTGWVLDGNASRCERQLYLVLETPVALKAGDTLRFRLVFDSGWGGHGFGRFRLSATDATDATKLLPALPAVAAAEVDGAIDKGVHWLLQCQAIDGTWNGPDAKTYRSGMTALALYTLIKCGLPTDHPALRTGFAWLSQERPTRTYDTGCVLMALGALGDPKHAALIAQLAQQVQQSVGAGPGVQPGEWGYPGNHGNPRGIHADLSNTQYALLGLRAATHVGAKVDPQIWVRVSQWLCDRQESYGGFGYRPGSTATASMTAAGAGSLLICARELRGLGKEFDAPALRAEAGAGRATMWMKAHWSVEQNIEGKFTPGKGGDRWLYYWLYGLERVGSLSEQRLIGDHDWYQEGAQQLVRRQNANGQWDGGGYGDDDCNTCFALLFLRRGTGTTAPAPRGASNSEATKALMIGASAEWPPSFWVRAVGKPVDARLAKGEVVDCVRWFIDDLEVACVKAPGADPRQEAWATRWSPSANGAHKLVGRMFFTDAAGAACGTEESPVLALRIDNVTLAQHGEAIRDAGHNLLERDKVALSASSEYNGHVAPLAIDGRQSLGWLAEPKDGQPSITLRLGRPVQAGVLKLSQPRYWLQGAGHMSRVRNLQVKINNEAPFTVQLDDDVMRKHAIIFPKKLVRTLKLTVLATYAGTYQSTGFQEIELFADAHPDDASTSGQGAAVETVVAPGRESAAVRWRYTTTLPEDGWESTGARKGVDWKEGSCPFGVMPAGRTAARTAWVGESLWLREEFELRQLREGVFSLDILADDTASVWVNGVFAGEVPYTGGNYKSVSLSAEAAAALKQGPNLLAVHVSNTGGPGAVDIGLYFTPAAAAPSGK